jgi:hypothetical protein
MTRLRLHSGRVEWREVDGELIALERSESVYLAGNESATILWQALARGTTDAALADLLVARYGVARAVASSDVARFLDALTARGLLEAA